MTNGHKFSAGLAALSLLASHPAAAADAELIHSRILARAGISAEVIGEMTRARVLVKVSDDCFTLDRARMESVRADLNLVRFVEQMSRLAGETMAVGLCEIPDMQIGSQDGEPLQ